jgi:hypothetical protein
LRIETLGAGFDEALRRHGRPLAATTATIENCAADEPLFLAVGCQLSAVGQKGQGYWLRRDQ